VGEALLVFNDGSLDVLTVNFDSEPYAAKQIRFSVQASAIKVVLSPTTSPDLNMALSG
jgi:hypothetical protein